MLDLSSLLDDEDLRRRYGTPTLDRAWDYVRHGHVLTCTHDEDDDGDLDVRGTVSGSTSAPYAVTISIGVDGDGPWVHGRCTCPVGTGCKHALALLITVREEHRLHSPGPDRRWERQLSSLLDELDARAEAAAVRPDSALALQVDLKPRAGSGSGGWATARGSRRGALGVRPLRRGSRGSWVRPGIGWNALPPVGRDRRHPPAQVA